MAVACSQWWFRKVEKKNGDNGCKGKIARQGEDARCICIYLSLGALTTTMSNDEYCQKRAPCDLLRKIIKYGCDIWRCQSQCEWHRVLTKANVMVGNKLFLRSNGHMVPGLSLLQSKSLALNEMVMTWRHCCNWAVGDVFTTMSVTDPAMPKAAWLKDSICLAKQVVCCQNQDYLTLSSGSQPPSMLHRSKCPYVLIHLVHTCIKGPSIYYVIQILGPERPPPL